MSSLRNSLLKITRGIVFRDNGAIFRTEELGKAKATPTGRQGSTTRLLQSPMRPEFNNANTVRGAVEPREGHKSREGVLPY